ncbi:hypothetical protein D3C87_176250 [compost metagenome]
MKSMSVLLILISISLQAQALKLAYYGETTIKHGAQFNKSVIGGLSGMMWADGTLYAVSDDKGRLGDPRFFEFNLKIKDKKIELTPKAVHFITGVPGKLEKTGGLDLEGLFRFVDGGLLLSSEGNSDSKPRVMPRILRVSSTGQWKSDLPLDDKYLPETTGQQKKGTQGNLAFESLTGLDGGKTVFTTTESALLQDVKSGEEELGDRIRIIKYEEKEKGLQAVAEYAYQIDAYSKNDKGQEFFRGVSEMLAVSDTKIIVLERGVRIIGKGWITPASLYLADLSQATDVSKVTPLSQTKIKTAEKTKLIDLEMDLTKERPDKGMQNFEALSWGPTLPDGRRTVLVMSDNNFSKKETMELLVFTVEGE